MKPPIHHLQHLLESLQSFIEQEDQACRQAAAANLEILGTLQAGSADRRLQHLAKQVKALQKRVALMCEMTTQDYLAKIEQEVQRLQSQVVNRQVNQLVEQVISLHSPEMKVLSEVLMDQLLEGTQAERGFIVFFHPESSEAEIISMRNFQTAHLTAEEYRPSRSLLRSVLSDGKSLLFHDISQDINFRQEPSIQNFGLKSVAITPLKKDGRVLGALYLENRNLATAFDAGDLNFLDLAGRLMVFCLHNARLLPILFKENRVRLNDNQFSTDIVGQSPAIIWLQEQIQKVADSQATVLIEGESGTGKELVARALHSHSRRRDRKFIALNCAAIPEQLVESELFGHERGAFTGAFEQHIGFLEQANGGTLFLDEISELPFSLQAKLLRVLQFQEFHRLGGKQVKKVEVRIVAATSKNLKELIDEKKFQEALYYRLNVIPLHVPPLRARKEDIAPLVAHFLKIFGDRYKKTIHLEPGMIEILSEYNFPGNIRELENLVHRLVVFASDNRIAIADLPKEILQIHTQRLKLTATPLYRLLQTPVTDLADIRQRRAQVKQFFAAEERKLVERAIEEANGNVTEAASRLGLHRATLHEILKKTDQG
ncbi:MAG: sigma-54-dependent Fis family transcriptional regulator [Acidobacteria bacterium]|nr:sigma-54-dependent Fis family transcriptional regulator [Acidobacteriota bacterium]